MWHYGLMSNIPYVYVYVYTYRGVHLKSGKEMYKALTSSLYFSFSQMLTTNME